MSLANALLTHAEVQVHGVCAAAGNQPKNTLFSFHYRRTGTVLTPDETKLESVFQTDIVVPLSLALNNRWTQQFNSVRFMDDPTRIAYQLNHAAVGAIAGDSMPSTLGVSTLYRTSLRGKSYRGGNKFFPISEADTTAATADQLNAASQALWATFLAAFILPLTDGNGNIWVPCVYSRKLSLPTQLPQAQIVTTDIASVLLNKTIRKRNRHGQPSIY